ncbi:MAG TPA: twin-arginine translocation signal domain-containing protein [Firmicutes bacterium]|nr:twin-arginine translocation signal domain-containing protein [Bacillota bacterium]
MSEVKEISRRKFLVGAGATIAGAALAGGIGGMLAGCEAQSAGKVETPNWPAEYKKLDPDKAAERGFNAYKNGG